MPGYADILNPDLINRIPLDARVILDVGCGMGALGAEYKRRNPACRVMGIEADPGSARVAASRLDQVFAGDVEANPLPFPGLVFDCIIYGDVLEHLVDPWTVLQQQVRALSPDGTVLICMPNAAHWSLTECLLRGTFDYEAQGLRDRTHLRWFTVETTRDAIVNAGLVPQSVTPRVFGLAEARAFTEAMAPALTALGIDPVTYLQRSSPLQHVWRARPTETQRLHVVSTILNPVGGVSDVRILEPMAAIATDSSVMTYVVPNFEPPDLPPDDPKIFIIHRPKLSVEHGQAVIRRLVGRGYLVVVEFDDHPELMLPSQRPDLHNFKAAHAVQTSTEPLGEYFRRLNPEVIVFPNAVTRVPDPRNYATADRLTLFFGGFNREDDWAPLLPALNAVAALAGDRLQFQIVSDRALFEGLRTPHKNFTPLCDYATYRNLLGGCEFSFMPLNDTPFNRCKSDLKFIEAAAHRVAAIASTTVYGDSVKQGETGFLYSDPISFQRILMVLLAEPSLGRAAGDAARSDIAHHRMLAYQVPRRVAWYRSLWDRREALRRALLSRIPELSS